MPVNALVNPKVLPIYTNENEAITKNENEFILQLNSNIRNTSTYEVWTKTKTRRVYTDIYLTYHPSFNGYAYRGNGVWFSYTPSLSFSVSLGIGYVSGSVGASTGGSGYFVECLPNRMCRPGIRGNVDEYTYSVQTYSGSGTPIGSARSETKRAAVDTRVIMLYLDV